MVFWLILSGDVPTGNSKLFWAAPGQARKPYKTNGFQAFWAALGQKTL